MAKRAHDSRRKLTPDEEAERIASKFGVPAGDVAGVTYTPPEEEPDEAEDQ